MEQTVFPGRTEAQAYFDEILKSMQGIKVTSVFSMCPDFSNHGPSRTYTEDEEIYILFENEECLVVFYPFIDALHVSFRPLTEEEKAWYDNLPSLKDYFNDSTDIYTGNSVDQLHLYRNQKISLEYDSIVSVSLEKVTKPYDKWIGKSLDEVAPKPTTFRKITFTMANGKSFVICPDDALFDGYTLVWSDDAQETITEF